MVIAAWISHSSMVRALQCHNLKMWVPSCQPSPRIKGGCRRRPDHPNSPPPNLSLNHVSHHNHHGTHIHFIPKGSILQAFGDQLPSIYVLPRLSEREYDHHVCPCPRIPPS